MLHCIFQININIKLPQTHDSYFKNITAMPAKKSSFLADCKTHETQGGRVHNVYLIRILHPEG